MKSNPPVFLSSTHGQAAWSPRFLLFLYLIWLISAGLLADEILTVYTKNLVRKESQVLEQQANVLASDFRRNLDQLYAVPRIVGLQEAFLEMLHALPASAAGSSVQERHQLWTKNSKLFKLNKDLSKLAELMNVQVLYIMNPQGDCVVSSNFDRPDSFVGSNFAQRDYFQLAKKNGRGFQYAVGSISNLPGFYFSAPIFERDQLLGVAVAKLTHASLVHWVDHSEAFISDEHGVVVLAKDRHLELRQLDNHFFAGHSPEEIQARYHRSDFPRLSIGAWDSPRLPELKYIDAGGPILLTSRKLSDEDELEGLELHVVKTLPVASFSNNRLILFGFFALLGAVVLLLGKLRLATLRKRAELDFFFNRLHKLTNRAPGMIFEFKQFADGHRCFPYSSDAIQTLFKVSPQQVSLDAGMVFSIVHREDIVALNASIQLSAQTLAPWTHEFRVCYSDGLERWLAGNAIPEREADGSVLWHGFITDMTERKLVEQEHARMSALLEQNNEQLIDYKEKIEEEESFAQEFIQQYCALDQIDDPLVHFNMQSADHFSGDMIAVARTPDGRLRLLLADSAGHGLTSALAVIPITGPFYRMTAKGFELAEIAGEINSRVREYLRLPRYVACVLMEIDFSARQIQIWNGGCPDVLLLNADGSQILHQFKSNNLPMGIAMPQEFSAVMERLDFPAQPCLLLSSSDGATELNLLPGQLPSHAPLLLAAQSAVGASFFERVLVVIKQQLNGTAPADDIALLLAEIK